jgi:hypothetical protein
LSWPPNWQGIRSHQQFVSFIVRNGHTNGGQIMAKQIEQSEYVLEFNRLLTEIQALSREYDTLWAEYRASVEKQIDARSVPSEFTLGNGRIDGLPAAVFTVYAQLKDARIALSTYIEQHAPVG